MKLLQAFLELRVCEFLELDIESFVDERLTSDYGVYKFLLLGGDGCRRMKRPAGFLC